MTELKYEHVSPIDLVIGDRVMVYGAIVEVARITEVPCDIPGGIRVAACMSRLVGDDIGSIPRSWFETPEGLKGRGCTWADELEPGLYWNVQGNAHARVAKILN